MNKLILLVTFCGISLLCKSQTVIYLDSLNKPVSSSVGARYYLTLAYDSTNHDKCTRKLYQITGRIMAEQNFSSFKENKYDGKFKKWFKNGLISYDADYKEGKLHGQLLTYWENGKLKRQDYYDNGQYVNGKCLDSLGNAIPHFDYIIMPQFPGGNEAITSYLCHHIHYPQRAKEEGVQGKVMIEFMVATNGSMEEFKVQQGINPDLDNEALRVVESLPLTWEPGFQDGEPIRVSYSLPVTFKIKPKSVASRK